MQVVRHEDVFADNPGGGVCPDVAESGMSEVVGEPGEALLSGYSEKNDALFSGDVMDTCGGKVSSHYE